MRRRPSRRHGVSIIIAIALLGMVATAMVILTKQLGYEARRSRDGADEAQLRQLLLAGARTAVETMNHEESPVSIASVRMSLPDELSQRGASASIQFGPVADKARDARVVARFDDQEARQTLRFRRDNGKWTLVGARLGQ